MTDTRSTEFDDRECYCRILGHHLHFSYCRSYQDGLPCYKILDCWFEKFEIREFIRDNFTPEEIERFMQAPKPKVQTLMSLIEQAQKRMKKD
ncbi:MAG: hypothetical protein P8Z37_02415 [Acidobacteriota bacterium]